MEDETRNDDVRNDDVSIWDRLRGHKTTVLTGAGAALVLAGCVLAMSAIIDSASFSSGSRQPSGGGASITAPQPSTSSGSAGPTQAEDEDEREDSDDDDVDDEDDVDDVDDDD